MRITAGRLKGHPLIVPEGQIIRPTSDKVRQAIFNVLEHHDFGADFELEHSRVIDLFAGSGALGLEALSRGASYAILIDNLGESRATLRSNVEAMELTGVTKIWRRNATDLGRNINEPFDLAFLDPPYGKNLLVPALSSLQIGGWLQPHAIVVTEAARGEDIPSTDSFQLLKEKYYGMTKVSFWRPILVQTA
jgi:16S rRNA (guanine966-N2)-methyltransferase